MGGCGAFATADPDQGGSGSDGGASAEGGTDAEAGGGAGAPGDVVWFSAIGAERMEQVSDLSVDSSGSVIVVGTFNSSSLDLGCASALTRNPNGGESAFDAFIVKLDAGGTCVWARSVSGDGREQAYGVAVDPTTDAIYVVGATDSASFVVDGTEVATSGASNGTDGFLIKLDAGGSRIFAEAYGGSGYDALFGVAVGPSGQVVTTGTRTKVSGQDMTFGGVTLAAADTPRAYAFAAGFTSAGNPTWGRTIRGHDGVATAGLRVAVDSLGNAIVTGTVDGALEPFNYPTTSGGLGSPTGEAADVFVIKIDGSGAKAHSWAQVFGGPHDEEPAGLALDGADNVYLLSGYAEATAFGGAPLPAPGSNEIALAKFQPGGAHVFSKALTTAADDFAGGVAAAPDGSHVVVGAQGAPFDFGTGLTSNNGREDMFVVSYDAAGKASWARTFGGAGVDMARAVAIDGPHVVVAGRFFSPLLVDGEHVPFRGGADVLVLKLRR
jgi:hypothetical protein